MVIDFQWFTFNKCLWIKYICQILLTRKNRENLKFPFFLHLWHFSVLSTQPIQLSIICFYQFCNVNLYCTFWTISKNIVFTFMVFFQYTCFRHIIFSKFVTLHHAPLLQTFEENDTKKLRSVRRPDLWNSIYSSNSNPTSSLLFWLLCKRW